MLASPKKMEKEKASKGDPKSISILENKGPATEISWNRLQKLLPRTS